MVLYPSPWGNVEIWVENSGQRVHEYAHKEINANSEECYIPSNAGEVRDGAARIVSS